MSDCKECGTAKIPDQRGFELCVPCTWRRLNKALTQRDEWKSRFEAVNRQHMDEAQARHLAKAERDRLAAVVEGNRAAVASAIGLIMGDNGHGGFDTGMELLCQVRDASLAALADSESAELIGAVIGECEWCGIDGAEPQCYRPATETVDEIKLCPEHFKNAMRDRLISCAALADSEEE